MALTQEQLNRILGNQSVVQRAFNENRPTVTNTPRSIVSGTYADILKRLTNNLVGNIVLGDVQRGLESASYNQPLTTGGSVQTGGFRPEYLALALGLTPMGKGKKLTSLNKNIDKLPMGLQTIPIEKLGNPAKFSPKSLDFIESLKKELLTDKKMMPIELNSSGEIIDGSHRAKALLDLGIKDVPVFVGAQSGSSGRLLEPYNGIRVDIQSPKTTFEVAQETAQRNASLPVSEGGLGLPATNTAMDRAKAMGFDTEKQWLHGTRNDFNEFSRTKDIGYHFGDKWQANDRAGSGTTSNVIPVYLKNNNIINTDDVYGSNSTFPIYGNLRDKGYISQDEIDNIFGTVIRADHDKALNNLLKSKNYGGIEYDNMVEGIRTNLRNNGTKNTARIVLDQTQIRSPNAAFDPFRRNEADILAGVGVGVPTAGLLDEKKKKPTKK